MTATFKVLSILLSYPTAESIASAPELAKAIADEDLLPARVRKSVVRLIEDIGAGDLFDQQERYVQLFDRSRSLSLHIFEHIHGESRDRGQAMVDLMQHYERHGLAIEAKELPDYLPLFLEFLSVLPLAEARQLLSEPLHIVSALKERHRKRKSAFTGVFAALEALADGKAEPKAVAELLAEPEVDPDDLEALDRDWEEAAVTFGPESAGTVSPDGSCPAARATLARIDPKTDTPKP